MIYTSQSAKQTQSIAESLAKKTKPGTVIALFGHLGAGKTTFTQGFARGLNIDEKIISPTFILEKIYPIPETDNRLIHLDLYRLETQLDIKNLGLEEVFTDKNSIVLIEWSERLGSLLPKQAIKIKFERIDEDKRKIVIQNEENF